MRKRRGSGEGRMEDAARMGTVKIALSSSRVNLTQFAPKIDKNTSIIPA
jgi:hypothetical protein